MNQLVIVGAGGFGREVLAWARHSCDCGTRWGIAGFLDANPHALRDYAIDLPILGDPLHYEPRRGDLMVVAIAKPSTRKQIVSCLASKEAAFVSLCHPSALIGERVSIGQGSIICPGVVITCDVRIGDFVIVNVQTTIGHDVSVADFVTVSGRCDINGHCTIGAGAFLGTKACCFPSMVVEENATVGAGSIVCRRVPAGTTVYAPPARRLD